MSRECGETVCYEGCSLPQVATPLLLLNPFAVAVVFLLFLLLLLLFGLLVKRTNFDIVEVPRFREKKQASTF